MQTWEYQFLEDNGEFDTALRMFIFHLNGQRRDSPNLDGLFNELGDEGWELAGVLNRDRTIYIFKRPSA